MTENAGTSRSASRWWWAFAALIVLSIAVRIPGLDADAPGGVSRDLSLTTDSSWYTGAALDWATGRPRGIGDAYDPPLLGAVYRAAFALLGATRRSAALVSVVFAVAAIALTALAVRRRHGEAAGLAAGAVLSVSFAYYVFSRVPGVYVPLSALAALLLYLDACAETSARRSRAIGLACWGVVALGAFGVKPVFLLNGIALGVARGLPALRDPRVRGRLIAFGGPLAAIALVVLWQQGWLWAQYHKISEYLLADGGIASIPQRVLTVETRLGLVANAPLLVCLASVAVIFPGGAARRPRLEVSTCLVFLGLLAVLGYSPLRYFVPALPALAAIAGSELARIANALSGAAESTVEPAPRSSAGRILHAVASGFVVVQIAIGITGIDGGPGLSVLVFLALVGGATSARWAGSIRDFVLARPRARRFAIRAGTLALAVLVALDLGRTGIAVAESERSLELAGREVAAILPADAHVTGPFAHALTAESTQSRSYAPVFEFGGGKLHGLRELGITHFAVDVNEALPVVVGAFEHDGASLEPVLELVVRGQKVRVYRMSWADELVAPSDFELGLRALRAGKNEEAREHLGRAHEASPRSAAIAAALAFAELERGDRRRARALLDRAVAENPYELGALRTRLELALDAGELRLALEDARRLRELDPADRQAAELVEKLRAVVSG